MLWLVPIWSIEYFILFEINKIIMPFHNLFFGKIPQYKTSFDHLYGLVKCSVCNLAPRNNLNFWKGENTSSALGGNNIK